MTPVDASVTSTGNSELSSLDIAKIQARPDNLAVWTGCTCIVSRLSFYLIVRDEIIS